MPFNDFGGWSFQLPKKKFAFALLASIAVHVSLLLVFQAQNMQRPIIEKAKPNIMDVTLLDESQPKAKLKPKDDTKVIANKDNIGNQVNAQDKMNRIARAPSSAQADPNPNKPLPITPQAPRIPAAPSKQQKSNNRILSRKDENSTTILPIENDFKAKEKDSPKPAPIIPLANLLPSSSALTQLSRDFDRERRMKQLLSKEADIGINTRESKYAPYAQGLVRALEEQWSPRDLVVAKVHPDERKVLMKVSIGHNGELEDIKIIRPSPSSELNDSAVAAVYKAAPFKPLPTSWGLERANFFFMFEVTEGSMSFRTL